MSTMALAEEGRTRAAEPHLAAEREEVAIGLVPINERLERGVDDIDLAPQTSQATGPRRGGRRADPSR